MNYDDDIDNLEKNEYIVRIPVTGFVEVTINADNTKDAIDRALDLNVDINEPMTYDYGEFETHEIIIDKDNTFNGVLNEIEVEEI